MYVNYGDVNFFEYGCLVDADHSDTEFSILYCRPFDDEDDLYYFGDCVVDITDSWIDKTAVLNYIEMVDDTYDGEFDSVQFAIGCVEYYGVQEFNGGNISQFSKSAICEILKHRLIASDNRLIEW